MGSCYLASSLLLALLFKGLAFQQPNTDGFFLAIFLQKMGVKLPSDQNSTSSSICSWSGVSCDPTKENVVSVMASGLGLSGPTPDNTIGKLNKLEALDLSMNSITDLSSDLWGLGSSLKSLNLSMNTIRSDLLNNIGNFGNLESLDLSHNHFFGEVPQGISSMLSLRILNLSRNSFQGNIPEGIIGCKNLVALDLSVNQLNGSFPNGFSNGFKDLSFLDLAGNRIQGAVLDFSGLESIKHINVSGNLLQGSVTGLFHGALSVLDLSNNQFSQIKISSSFNLSSLIYLDISGNNLNGYFLNNLGQASSLKHLNIAENRFSTQKLPQFVGFPMLEYLNLSRTSLTGNIPAEISQLVGLRALDLSHNQLSGKVPELTMPNLAILDISSNNLTGEIPPSLIEKLPQMKIFNFSINNLTFCAKKLSLQRFNSSFIGSENSCPLAANPDAIQSIITKHTNLKLALIVSLSAVCAVVGIICLFLTCRKRRRSWAVKQIPYKEEQNLTGHCSFGTDSTAWVADVRAANLVPVVMFEKPLLSFTFADLLSATGNFDRGTLLSEGSFGPVYRGFLPGGMQVAMKILLQGSPLTDQDIGRELERLGRIKHQNLVPLTGYCLAGDQRIAIYEYMENGNLQNLLHDLPLGVQTTEDWSTDTWENESNGVQNITTEGVTTWRFRYRIALGVARALAFLHHGCFPQVVHGDVKASNVYLDSFLEPRLSYFGLEKVLGRESVDEISTATSGYIPPELCDAEKASSSASASANPKVDVFAFGVVLFELVTGRKPADDECPEEKKSSLVEWARPLVKKKQYSSAIDPKIRDTGPERQMEEALKIAYLCTADLPLKRPSMQQIVGLLKDMEPVGRD